MLVALDNSGEASSSSPDPQLKFWKSLWSLRVPNKVKHFAWRASNIIPRAGSLLQEFVSAQEVLDESPSVTVSSQWQPPEFPYYKVKFDVVVFKASSSARIGVIIRDSSGNAIGDSAVVIQAVIQGNSMSAEYGNIIEDIRILAADFDFIHFIHVKRNCNVVADALAKKAKVLPDLVVWLEDVPEDIAPLLLFDVP
uniref:RNase H type-1 domain-containing protein n=1 Tax=Quercus lobata TaxID=97700 RepID=A0A7N2MBE6_QUELO